MDVGLHSHAIGLIAKLLKQRTGQIVSDDRRWRIDRAIETVLRKRGIARSSDILTLLTQPDAATVEEELVEALLNNETYFFRDRQVFTQLSATVIPALCRAKGSNRNLRIWSVGCSTGQEPLSLAIMLIEQGLTPDKGWSVDLVGTDVSRSAIAAARKGLYSRFEIQRGLGVGQMLLHFHETADGWQASDQLLNMITYRHGDILSASTPHQPYDLILCRNVMLYFDEAGRTDACQLLRQALASHGRLLLGGGETLAAAPHGFATASHDFALYRRSESMMAA